MRKICLLLLVTLIAAQSALAAAARYCDHEARDGNGTAQSAHFGHHEHQHDHEGADDVDHSHPGNVHLDCAYCQLGFAQSLPALSVALDAPAPCSASFLDPRLITSAPRDGIARPPKPPAA